MGAWFTLSRGGGGIRTPCHSVKSRVLFQVELHPRVGARGGKAVVQGHASHPAHLLRLLYALCRFYVEPEHRTASGPERAKGIEPS